MRKVWRAGQVCSGGGIVNHPRQAIVVTFVSPTDKNLDPRFRAKCEAGSIVRYCDSDVDNVENAHRTAIELCEKLGWPSDRLVAGSLPNHGGFVYVLADGGAYK